MSENLIELMNEVEYKGLIKSKVKEEALNEFKNMQAGHQKGNTLNHDDLKQPQSYLMTNKPNNSQVSLLFNIRTQCMRGITDTFHGQNYQKLECDLCKVDIDTQNHILEFHVLKQHIKWKKYSTSTFMELFNNR